MSHAERPAAVGGGVRENPRSGLGAATSPVSATLAHPPVGGRDQIPNPLTASPVSSHTRFHQLVRPIDGSIYDKSPPNLKKLQQKVFQLILVVLSFPENIPKI